MSNAEVALLQALNAFGVARSVDLATLARVRTSRATIGRFTKALTTTKQARYISVGDQRAVATARASSLSPATQAYCLQRSILWAALISDGYDVDNGDRARLAHRSHLLRRTDRPNHGSHFARLSEQWIHDLPLTGATLPYDVAWTGPAHAPTDLKLVVIPPPRQAPRKYLEELPLRVLGVPKVSILLRVPEARNEVDKLTGKLLYKGPRTRTFLHAFRARHKNLRGFPYWETAVVDTSYRPELWVAG